MQITVETQVTKSDKVLNHLGNVKPCLTGCEIVVAKVKPMFQSLAVSLCDDRAVQRERPCQDVLIHHSLLCSPSEWARE